MKNIKALVVDHIGAPFESVLIERRALGPEDVLIDIAFCGLCHSDVSYVHNEWGRTRYPLVPGHEIAGIVAEVGSRVSKYAVGDRVGVGCLVDTCGECPNCLSGEEQHCTGLRVSTYSAVDRKGQDTLGGYSEKIVVNENFVVRIPDAIDLKNAAPLLCAGVTVFSPLKHWNVGPGTSVAVVGFGGLGHVAVQIAKAMGAIVTVLDLSLEKRDDALRLGATKYFATSEPDTFVSLDQSLDLILCTVPANLDLDEYFRLLRLHGKFVIVGLPKMELKIDPFSLIVNERVLAGSRIGSIKSTQEMLNFCAEHGIVAEVEVVAATELGEAYERMLKGDVRFRFVLDTSTLS